MPPTSQLQEKSRELSDADKIAAHNAWYVLHECSVQPGTDDSGAILGEAFIAFIDASRGLASEADRLSELVAN